MNVTVPSSAKALIPFVYSASGWLMTEIPVLMGALPATIDGYSTTSLAAAGAFVLSAAYYVHSHLAPYISPSVSPSSSNASASVSVPSSQVAAATAAAPVEPTPSGVPQFSQGGTMINYTLEQPIGTVQGSYVVGLTYNNATSASGAKVPNGAFYLGDGTFGINGNYYD